MAVAFVQNPAAGAANSSTPTTGSATWTTGNVAIVGVASATGSDAVNTLTASGGSIRAFALPGSIRNSSPGVELWLVFILTGFTGTLTANMSAVGNHVIVAAEYSGVTAVGVAASSAPATTANPSITLTTSGAQTWVVGVFAANSTAAFTTGTGTLRVSGSVTNVGGALVDNPSGVNIGDAGTCAVTHASATWGIGLIELYAGGIDYGNGAYSLAGPGTNGYLAGFSGFLDGVAFTTGGNPGGYTLNSVALLTDDTLVDTSNVRGGVYDNTASPNRVLIVDAGTLAAGIPAGSGSPNLHTIRAAATLAASTTYWIFFNNDGTGVGLAYRVDDTTGASGASDRFRTQAFGALPNPMGAEDVGSPETFGPHMWVHVTAVAGAVTERYQTRVLRSPAGFF